MAKREKKKPPTVAGPLTVSDRIQRQLAAVAIEKTRHGERPTFREQAALKALEGARDKQLRAAHYRTIPKGDWVRWSGRPHGTLNRQADRHGMPIRGRTVDLPAVVHWIHDLLAKYGQKLTSTEDTDPLLQGTSSPALEQYRAMKTKLAALEFGRQSGHLIPRAELEPGLDLLTNILREAGESLRRGYGEDAASVLNEAMDEWDRGWRALLNERRTGDANGVSL